MTTNESHRPIALGGALLFAAAVVGLAAAPAQTEREFGGEYASLSPAQQRLIEDLCNRFAATTGQRLDCEATYNRTQLSTRTTFNAVTHALVETRLTDGDQTPLGTALDLIEHVEAVHGKVPGARGDAQFRIYVRMKPDALATLDRSREFSRGMDNTVYHKGYPLNYRQIGGVPSIQISMIPDGQRADIDVDYRSAKFPAALINGHLTSANSDVRAGNNHDRHNRRWEGLAAWWQGLFGLLLGGSESGPEDEIVDTEIALVPRAGKESIEVAVHDFLSSWLVERRPGQALGYLSERALRCLELDRDPDAGPLDYGMAPVELLQRMRAVNQRIGRVTSLGEASTGVRLVGPQLTLVQQPYHAQFVLYGLTDAFAESVECANQMQAAGAEPPLPATSPGRRLEDFNYFGTSLFLARGAEHGSTLLLLWAKEEGNWRIVSYEVEPEGAEDQTGLPDMHAETDQAPLDAVEAPEGLVEASTDYLEDWLIRKDVAAALSRVSPTCYPCINLFLNDGESPAADAEAQRRRIEERMEAAVARAGDVSRLEDVIAAAEPAHPELKLVQHGREEAFALLSVPDSVAAGANCLRRLENQPSPARGSSAAVYGNYYASAFHIETAAGEPAVLYLGWGLEEGSWRILAFDIVLP